MGTLTIDMGADWAPYTGPLDGVEIIGTVRRTDSNVTRALAVVEGRYFALANGKFTDLDQRSVNAALGQANAKKLDNGRRINLYLPADAIDQAKVMGLGNISLGLRIALGAYQDEKTTKS